MPHYDFFQHKQCEYFPCHKTEQPEQFNCLFCYCPLYALKDKCGGNFRYLESGIKDCSNCLVPHGEKGFEHVMAHRKEVVELGSVKEK